MEYILTRTKLLNAHRSERSWAAGTEEDNGSGDVPVNCGTDRRGYCVENKEVKVAVSVLQFIGGGEGEKVILDSDGSVWSRRRQFNSATAWLR